ncbi:dsDNA-binding protein PDCD5 [Penicillium herquei]|nr:dsDNA-binding protein PDCD5 [Penicillium herquei]
MADAELEEIRRARLAQLQQGGPRGGPSQESGQDEQRRYIPRILPRKLNIYCLAERRAAILNQILDPAAADRLGRIRLVKESRAVDIENRLLMLAQTGQLRQKVTEEQLKELLNAVAENQRKEEEEQKIVITRRRGGWDDDDDLLDL